jgi:zinc/manganese transport system substrate-binding protein
MNRAKAAAGILIVSLAALAGCQRAQSPASGAGLIVATENFLADMTRQVVGDRFSVRSLIPAGVEPHGYEPTPQDIAAVAGARLLVVNGAGLESFQARLLANAGGTRLVVEASRGLVSRAAREGETVEGAGGASGAPAEPDPHFWLDPVLAVTYVQNIRDAVVSLDPRNAALYRANAAAFIPSISSDTEPSARQLARLVNRLRSADVSAVFLETGSNPRLARQVAEEAGIKVVTELYTHALSGADGPAATYIEMMEEDARIIASALRGSR